MILVLNLNGILVPKVQKAAGLRKIRHGKNTMHKFFLTQENAGLTQQELADRIGADKSYVSRVERGLIIPSVSTLYRIAAAMGLTVELHPAM